jgi:hypothetical protein
VPLTHAPLPADAHAHTFVPATAAHALAGHGQGTYSNPVIHNALTVDALTTYNFRGKADLAGLGHVTVTGSVHSVGFVLTGHATGQLTFSNAKGSVTVQLTGPMQQGFSALPTTFSYKVVGHTGAYAKLADHGSLTLALYAQVVNYVPQPQGTFALTI